MNYIPPDGDAVDFDLELFDPPEGDKADFQLIEDLNIVNAKAHMSVPLSVRAKGYPDACILELVEVVELKTVSGVWKCPVSVTEVLVECWGGGGSGKGGEIRGKGGGGSAYAAATIGVVPGNNYIYTVAKYVQTPAPNNPGVDGEDTYWDDGLGVKAVGGKAGSYQTGGLGGQAADCVGDVKYSGGNGDYGGGGAAGSTGPGKNASGRDGGAATEEYGGKGGNAKTSLSDGNGESGYLYGGGGGGGYGAYGYSSWPGGGAPGLIRLTYNKLVAVNPEAHLSVSMSQHAAGKATDKLVITSLAASLSGPIKLPHFPIPATWAITAKGGEPPLEYAFYVLRRANGPTDKGWWEGAQRPEERLLVQWRAPRDIVSYTITEPGVYFVRGFVRDADGVTKFKDSTEIEICPALYRAPTLHEALTGPRLHEYRYELLDSCDKFKADLLTVQSGEIVRSIYNTIRSGGTLEMIEPRDTGIDYLNDRLKIFYRIKIKADWIEWPLGVFLFGSPGRELAGAGPPVRQIEIYDKLLILNQDKFEHHYTVDAAAVVTDVIGEIILATGEDRIAITGSVETLPSPRTWEPGTSRLRVINDLLSSINYLSLWADGNGYFRAEPYISPASRPVAWTFYDDAEGLYAWPLSVDADYFNVANKVVLVMSTPEDEELVAVAANEDPASPFSYPARGRWIVDCRGGGDDDAEATSLAVLQAKADRILAEASQVTEVLTYPHAWLPLELNDAVLFRSEPLNLSARYTLASQRISLNPMELIQSEIRRVIAND